MTVLSKFFRPKPTTDHYYALSDTNEPDDALKLVTQFPQLANEKLGDEPWDGGYYILPGILEMEGVKVHHVQGVLKRTLRCNIRYSQLLDIACRAGCSADIILYLLQQSSKAALKRNYDGNLPFFTLLGTCNNDHLPALEELLRLSACKVKKDIPKYVQHALANQKCPQEVLDMLSELGQGRFNK